MLEQVRRAALTVLALVPLLLALSCGRGGSGPPSTRTRSSEFSTDAEKVAFLGRYLKLPTRVGAAEFYVVYHNNSSGMAAGPSKWDISAVLKVHPLMVVRVNAETKRQSSVPPTHPRGRHFGLCSERSAKGLNRVKRRGTSRPGPPPRRKVERGKGRSREQHHQHKGEWASVGAARCCDGHRPPGSCPTSRGSSPR